MLEPDRPQPDRRPEDRRDTIPVVPASEQLRLVRQFVARVGGLDAARRALTMLDVMNRAA